VQNHQLHLIQNVNILCVFAPSLMQIIVLIVCISWMALPAFCYCESDGDFKSSPSEQLLYPQYYQHRCGNLCISFCRAENFWNSGSHSLHIHTVIWLKCGASPPQPPTGASLSGVYTAFSDAHNWYGNLRTKHIFGVVRWIVLLSSEHPTIIPAVSKIKTIKNFFITVTP
jgi:hypothetical protein